MSVVTLLDAVDETGAGEWFGTVREKRVKNDYGTVQAIITDTATVKLQGSLDGETAFDIQEFTSSDGKAFDLPPFVRGNVTAYTSGTVTLKADI